MVAEETKDRYPNKDRRRNRSWTRAANIALSFGIILLFIWIIHTFVGPRGLESAPAGLLALITILHVVFSLRHHRKAEAIHREIAAGFGLEPTKHPARPRNPWTRHLYLVPLEGTYQGRGVTVTYRHLPWWASASSRKLWLIGGSTYETEITTRLQDPKQDLMLKLEPRKGGERTDTRLTSPLGTKDRTRFEEDHHLFTEDPTLVKEILDAEVQDRIERFGDYDSLRVRNGAVTLDVQETAGSDRLREGLGIVVLLATRVDRLPVDPATPQPTQTGSVLGTSRTTGQATG